MRLRAELRDRLNRIKDMNLSEAEMTLATPRPLALLADAEAMRQFKATCEWVIQKTSEESMGKP